VAVSNNCNLVGPMYRMLVSPSSLLLVVLGVTFSTVLLRTTRATETTNVVPPPSMAAR